MDQNNATRRGLGGEVVEMLRKNIRNYAMYIALIIPDARKSRPVTAVILFAAAVSCLLTFLPASSSLGSGWIIIIGGLAASAFGAAVFPRPVGGEEDEA